tara:strand:+ start:49237 stop:50100 length:864 start_codon:yes stop_codon:yes gene_type:complete
MNKTKKVSDKCVVTPLTKEQLLSFLDDKSKNVIKYFLIKSLFSQPEAKLKQRTLPIQVPKEHIEQWFTQSLDVEPVGAGSYPIDIYNSSEHWGADIKMLNIKVDVNGLVKNNDSGEASLGQNFSGAGIDLDQLFRDKEYEVIKNNWVSLLKGKFESLKKDLPIKKIYYFFILRPSEQVNGVDFYFCGAEIDVEKFDSLVVNEARTTKTSVFLTNFLPDDLGNTKIYKSKKRLELRLKPKNWVDQDLAVRISTSYMPNHFDLRSEVVDEKFLKARIDEIKKLKVEFIA